jgi:glycosyltransferase involved in cell wall biosynthesis
MRVLHVCHWDLSSPDAETIRKLALTRELARLGHEVVLLAPALGRARERMPRGARIVYAPTLGGRFAAHLYALTALPLLALLALTWRPDAVYVTDHTASAPLALLLRALGQRFVLEVNGIPLQDARLQGIESGLWLTLIGLFSKTTYRLASRVAVVSPEIEANVKAALGGAIEVAVVPNGVDLELWRPEKKDAARERLGLPRSRPIVGFLGGFWPWQGLDRLVLAAPLVLAREPETLFLLAGFGPEAERLRALVLEKGLERSFLFPGKIPLEDGPTWVNAFDVGVHLVTPGKACSPVKLLCYMACARRCVATQGVDGFEAIEREDAGRRVDYGSLDSIAQGVLAELARARPEDGAGPRVKAVSEHGWEGVARATEALLLGLRAGQAFLPASARS